MRMILWLIIMITMLILHAMRLHILTIQGAELAQFACTILKSDKNKATPQRSIFLAQAQRIIITATAVKTTTRKAQWY